MWKRMAHTIIQLDDVLLALRSKKVPFVLTGAHGISTWTGQPRATRDIDILVKSGRNFERALKTLRELYPRLEIHRLPGIAAFLVPGEEGSVIDLVYPHRRDIEETLKTAIWIDGNKNLYRIPRLEAALANKYGAMLAPHRDPGKRGIDAVDFYNMVQRSLRAGREPIDLELLRDLGELVWPGGGGEEVMGLVEQVKAGQVPKVRDPDVTPPR
jgi:hypothetical protein